MPLASESPRCSDFAKTIALRPAGTGLFLQRVILVSVPLPWPKPALKHELLVRAADATRGAELPTRLFAAEPAGSDVYVEVYERHGAHCKSYRWTPVSPSPAALGSLVEKIVATSHGELESVDGATVLSSTTPTFLICTQGSHDSCCGTSGVALANELEANNLGWIIRRVSHTGGHRFSPTMLAFPEGRMWAFVDRALADRVATGTTTSQDHLTHGRGWWGAKVGPMQAAEIAVRAASTNGSFEAPEIGVVEGQDESTNTFAIQNDSGSWHVGVHVARQVPTVSCESPGGLPVKPGREFGWSIERL